AQSSCRYELKNGLSVVGEFSWRGRFQRRRKAQLSSAFSVYSASRPRSRLQPQA
ncbi:hypothetical protein BYT27DRAFT_7186121, partial [Phlegmacium glaucopus]